MAFPMMLIRISPEPSGVGADALGHRTGVFHAQSQFFGNGSHPHQGDDLRQDSARRAGGLLDLHSASLDLGHVEDVVNELKEVFGVLRDHVERVAGFRLYHGTASGASFGQQFQISQDGGHGRADFVAHVGQKTAFGLVCRFRRLLGLGEFDFGESTLGDVFQGFHAAHDVPLHVFQGDRGVIQPFPLLADSGEKVGAVVRAVEQRGLVALAWVELRDLSLRCCR